MTPAVIRHWLVADESVSDSVAGNCVVIEHNDREHGHLSNFEGGCFQVAKDQDIEAEQILGLIRFSDAATGYRHLRDQLMNGPDFLVSDAPPAKIDRGGLRCG